MTMARCMTRCIGREATGACSLCSRARRRRPQIAQPAIAHAAGRRDCPAPPPADCRNPPPANSRPGTHRGADVVRGDQRGGVFGTDAIEKAPAPKAFTAATRNTLDLPTAGLLTVADVAVPTPSFTVFHVALPFALTWMM